MKNLKNQIIVLAFAFLAFTLSSCEPSMFGIEGDGPIVSQEFTFTELEGINSSISGNVHLTQSDDQVITIKAQQNIIDNMEMDVHNGILDLGFDRSVRNHDGVDIYMSIKNLTRASMSGSGNIYTTAPFVGNDNLRLNLSGSGNFNIEADAPEVYASISGSGNFTIATNTDYFQGSIAGSGKYIMSGTALVADYTISGSGEISAFNLVTEETDINISGSGDSRVTVTNMLNISISGSGDVFYKGTPKIDTDISGSGNIRNAN